MCWQKQLQLCKALPRAQLERFLSGFAGRLEPPRSSGFANICGFFVEANWVVEKVEVVGAKGDALIGRDKEVDQHVSFDVCQ